MIKIAIPGSAGRMGGMLIRAIAAAPDLELVAATDAVSYTHLTLPTILRV